MITGDVPPAELFNKWLLYKYLSHLQEFERDDDAGGCVGRDISKCVNAQGGSHIMTAFAAWGRRALVYICYDRSNLALSLTDDSLNDGMLAF